MAKWTETLEPYIKVQEEVRTANLNPTTGEDLIIGCVIFADAGPSIPTLISGQKEFKSVFASQDITESYINSLNNLYDCGNGGDPTLPATMWSNAYRLAGSNTLLVVRAGKSKGVNFVKSVEKNDNVNTYLLKDGVILKKVENFKIVVNVNGDTAETTTDGWAINVNGVGIIGNRVTDQGSQYDIAANNLPELVDILNDTPVFYSPSFKYYTNEDATGDAVDENTAGIKSVVFEEVYIANELIDKSDSRCPNGLCYLTFCQPDWKMPAQGVSANGERGILDINTVGDFEAPQYYAINNYNSASELRVRIRRFNHDAVVANNIDALTSLTSSSPSMYTPLKEVLDTFTKKGAEEPSDAVKARDFYEIAIFDPSLSGEVLFFNIGNISGRGDITVDEFNKQMSMIGFNLPKDLAELGINYSNYNEDNATWIETINLPEGKTQSDFTASTVDELKSKTYSYNGTLEVGKTVARVSTKYYLYSSAGEDQIYIDLQIDPTKYMILKASDSDLQKAIDLLEEDEVYITEGLSDLGNTSPAFQSYMANLAINKNYFYPISTVNSTNYMTIGNSISKISQNSYKLYASAPWDLDSGTLGWQFYASPDVLYWEAVSRNRRNNEEFRGVLGQTGGLVQYQAPVCEFNKKTRQLLLTKKINTVIWDTQVSAWTMNDNYTKQSENTIMSDDGNSRLMIRISKAIPVILKQYIGRKITDKLCQDIWGTIDYFFKTTILAYAYTVDDYQIFCEFDEALARQNKVKVIVNVRYSRSLKFINVINRAFDVGMDISSAE